MSTVALRVARSSRRHLSPLRQQLLAAVFAALSMFAAVPVAASTTPGAATSISAKIGDDATDTRSSGMAGGLLAQSPAPAVSNACTAALLLPLREQCGFSMDQLLRILSTRQAEAGELPAGLCTRGCAIAVYLTLWEMDACADVAAWLAEAEVSPNDVVQAVLGDQYDDLCQQQAAEAAHDEASGGFAPQDQFLPFSSGTTVESVVKDPVSSGPKTQQEPARLATDSEQRDGQVTRGSVMCADLYRQCDVDVIADNTMRQPRFLAEQWRCPAGCDGAPVALLSGGMCKDSLLERAAARAGGPNDPAALELLLLGHDGMQDVCKGQLPVDAEVNLMSLHFSGLEMRLLEDARAAQLVLRLRHAVADQAGVLTRYVALHADSALENVRVTVAFSSDDWVSSYKFQETAMREPSLLFAGTGVALSNVTLQSFYTEQRTTLEAATRVHRDFVATASTAAVASPLWPMCVWLVLMGLLAL